MANTWPKKPPLPAPANPKMGPSSMFCRANGWYGSALVRGMNASGSGGAAGGGAPRGQVQHLRRTQQGGCALAGLVEQHPEAALGAGARLEDAGGDVRAPHDRAIRLQLV